MRSPLPAERALRIVEGALEFSGEARRRYIERQCSGDAALRREVESLLRHGGGMGIDEDPTPPDADVTETRNSS
jgi:hypothetical protein